MRYVAAIAAFAVVAFIASLLTHTTVVQSAVGILIMGGVAWSFINGPQAAPTPVAPRQANVAAANAAGDVIKRDTVNRIISDATLTETQRNQMLAHLLDTPTRVPSEKS